MRGLDRNESYWLLSKELREAVSRVETTDWSTYPTYEALKQEIAEYVGVTPDCILVTPGSDAAIEHIARLSGGPGEAVILPTPTFYGYESIVDRVGSRIISCVYTERDGSFIFPIADTLRALAHEQARILFLCHPNNPLGCALSKEDQWALREAASHSDTLIVSDEAYYEFADGSSFLPYRDEIPTLVVLRTFSKAFALAGARVGYVIAAPKYIRLLEKQLLPWPIAHASVSIARALLARKAEVEACRNAVITERERFLSDLRTIPHLTAYTSSTNFILIRVAHAEALRARLLEAGVRVAMGESMSRFPDAQRLLSSTLRIAVPSPEDRETVLSVLAQP